MPLTNVINNLNFVIVAVVSDILAAYGRISVGLISSFLLYSRQFSRPFVDIANIYNNFQTAVAGAERIFEILEEEPEPADAPDALPLTAPRGEVEFSHVTFGYPACLKGCQLPRARRNPCGGGRLHRRGKNHAHQPADPFL